MSKVLPDSVLRCMSKSDRKSVGQQTCAEAFAKYEAKNEREIQKQIAAYLRRNNIWFAQSRTDKRTTNGNGTPDFIFSKYITVNHAQPFAIEVKYGKGELSDEQAEVMNKMIRDGWHYKIVRSLKEVINLLEAGKVQ